MEHLGISYIACHCVGTIVHLAIDGEYAGHILISDRVKPHAREAVQALKEAGIDKTVMLSGDIRKVADQVAGELGITEVYSELLPADKVAKVEELLKTKPEKEKLAFVGDGINDAPVLGRADIGTVSYTHLDVYKRQLYDDMKTAMSEELGVDQFYELKHTSDMLSSLFAQAKDLVPKSEAQILTETAQEMESGVPMYYAEQLQ